MSLNLTNLETYVHNFSLDKIKILSFTLLVLKLGLARKRINFYFFNCSAEFLTFSPKIISFWKAFLEENHVSSFIFSKSLNIFSYFHDPLSFRLSLFGFSFFSPVSFAYLSPIHSPEQLPTPSSPANSTWNVEFIDEIPIPSPRPRYYYYYDLHQSLDTLILQFPHYSPSSRLLFHRARRFRFIRNQVNHLRSGYKYNNSHLSSYFSFFLWSSCPFLL